jgi:proline iminopeptidase
MTITTQREGKVQVPGGSVWYKIVGDGPATPLVLLHGGPGAGHDYLEPMAALGDERPVVFYDQLGCGKSDIPDDTSLWEIGRFVQELAALRTALGLEQIHLLGQSWGGWLAIEYMLLKPEGIASLTLANTCASAAGFVAGARRRVAELPEDLRATIERCEAEGKTESAEYQAASFTFMQKHVCRVEPFPEYVMRTNANMGVTPVYGHMWGPSEFTMTGTLAAWDRRGQLAEISAPTLVVTGPYDEVTEDLAAELANGIPGARKVMIPNASHTPWIENPDAFFPELREHLRGNEPR